MIVKNKKSTLTAWCMYDWANSVYSLSISSAIFPIFYEKFAPKNTTFLGFNISSSALYEYCLSFSFLIVALIGPFLSGIADVKGNKKSMMRFFVCLGAGACMLMFGFNGTNLHYGLVCFLFATIGFAGSLVFYNSYLPDIATTDKFDMLSARGFTLGYIGSVTMLLLNLLFLQKSHWFGMDPPSATNSFPFRIGFLAVGIWWLTWSIWPLIKLPVIAKSKKEGGNIFKNGYAELGNVFKQVVKMKDLKRFLLAFFVYTMGVQTVIYSAAIYGSKQLLLPSDVLLVTILLIQLIGIAGAYFFAFIANKKGSKVAIILSLSIWIIACIVAFFVKEKNATQFILLACIVGIVMGGIQSLSRATYAKLIPGDKDNASFFSFFESTEKLAIVLGTFSFGLIDHLTGNMRNSILFLMLYFVIGICILFGLNTAKLKPKTV